MFNQLFNYITLDYAIFPVYSAFEGKCKCGNYDCIHKGKHSKFGIAPEGATKDIEEVKNMQELWMNSNIGIATGKISGIVVLDIDPRDGGDKVLSDFTAQYGELPKTVTTLSGGNGMHYYFKYPNFDIPSRNVFRPGFDFKSDGDWIIAPPSIHVSGNAYKWAEGLSPTDISIAELPEWLATLMRS